MDETFIIIISIIFLIVGLVGTVLPVLPGLLLSFVGLLLYKFGTGSDLSIAYIWIFGFLTLLSIVFNYIMPAKTTKKYGGTRWGSIGSVIGTFAGMFFIPVPFGFLIGMVLGTFIAEYLRNKDVERSISSTKGALLGFIYSTAFNATIGFLMLLVVCTHLILDEL